MNVAKTGQRTVMLIWTVCMIGGVLTGVMSSSSLLSSF
jgi:hypothetical protein